jgi:hypothetical protein
MPMIFCSPAAAIDFPSGANATVKIASFSLPANSSRLRSASQILALESRPPLTSRLPSELKAMLVTPPE